jgi:hypothetical protein
MQNWASIAKQIDQLPEDDLNRLRVPSAGFDIKISATVDLGFEALTDGTSQKLVKTMLNFHLGEYNSAENAYASIFEAEPGLAKAVRASVLKNDVSAQLFQKQVTFFFSFFIFS